MSKLPFLPNIIRLIPKIKDLSKGEYLLLVNSGLFYELYPEATGDYEEDIKLSKEGRFKIEID